MVDYRALARNTLDLRYYSFVGAVIIASVALIIITSLTEIKSHTDNPLVICALPTDRGDPLVKVISETKYYWAIIIILPFTTIMLPLGLIFFYGTYRKKQYLFKWFMNPQPAWQQTLLFGVTLLLSLIPNAFKNLDLFAFLSSASLIVWTFLMLVYLQPRTETGVFGCVVASSLTIFCNIIQCYPRNIYEWILIFAVFIVSLAMHFYYTILTANGGEILVITQPDVRTGVEEVGGHLCLLRETDARRLHVLKNRHPNPLYLLCATGDGGFRLISASAYSKGLNEAARECEATDESLRFLNEYYVFCRVPQQPPPPPPNV